MAAGRVGCFIGLTATDVIYRLERRLQPDEKMEAEEVWVGAGGPAANAAATFALLGGTAHLITAVGDSPWAPTAVGDLEACGVRIYDQALSGSLPVSSVLLPGPGERQVVSANRRFIRVSTEPPPGLPEDVDIFMTDAHFPELVCSLLARADAPIVFDPGSPKPGVAAVLPLATTVVGSATARPDVPVERVLDEWRRLGVRECAVTRGARSIYAFDGSRFDVAVPAVPAVDTLGAGDVLHGALAYCLAAGCGFRRALRTAAGIAAESCRHLGPRRGVEACGPCASPGHAEDPRFLYNCRHK